MKVVDILRRDSDGVVHRMARITADGDTPAVFDYAQPDYADDFHLLVAEQVVAADGRLVSAADGEAYVAALPDIYRGSRFWAEEVEGDP